MKSHVAGASGSKRFGVEPSVPFFLYKLRVKYAHTCTYMCTYTLHARVARRRGGELLPSGRGELQKSDRNCRLRNAIASATSRCDGGSPLSLSLSLSLSL